MTMAAKRFFGDYERLDRIARGGQGEVWRARHRKTGDECALKVIPRTSLDDRTRERFFREARALKSLVGTHIVRVLEVCEEPTKSDLWYAMELAPHGSLRAKIGTPWALQERQTAFLQICMGVLESHNAGIIHRDIKPDNVLCFPGPVFKVADFGLLRNEVRDTTTLTTTRQVIGTMQYWAPEVWRDPKLADRRTDIFALGVTMCEILNGERPELQVVSLEDIAQSVQEPYRELVPRLLHPKPDRRFQTVDELLKALGEAERAHAEVTVEVVRRQIETALMRAATLDEEEQVQVLELLRRVDDELLLEAFAALPASAFTTYQQSSPGAFEALLLRTALAIPKLRVPFPFNWLEVFTAKLLDLLPSLTPETRARAHDALVWMAFDFKRSEVRTALASGLWSLPAAEAAREFVQALRRSPRRVQSDAVANMSGRTDLSSGLRALIEDLSKSLA
jgi:serine/threonine protein kinase